VPDPIPPLEVFMSSRSDHYARLDYRKLIAWPKRLAREWEFLQGPLGTAPSRRLLDLGSGTGEHARYLAGRGFEVVGVDASDAMLEQAREGGVPPGVRFVEGDLVHVESVVDGSFGAAICLGNTLTHITDRAQLRQLFAGVRQVLLPGAPFILQVLNYERLVRNGQRCLPLTFLQDEDGEAIFLRVMTHKPGGDVVFTPALLRYRPDGNPPLEVVTSHNVPLHGWVHGDLDEALADAGFSDRQLFGTMAEIPYDPCESTDVVIVSRYH
jgi:glycine/sarcosine N-methyltransferase